jgi:CDK inhibitor PHO81
MNATGFRKILKKWDKRSKSTTKELYLARQVDVQPCFNRDVISELSDTAAANVRKLEGLCIAKGGEQTMDPAADGILSERRAELAVANAEAQDDLLSNIENELLSAVRGSDRSAVQNILASIPPLDTLDKEMQSQLARIYWRAAIADKEGEESSFDTAHLDFQFVDDINGRTPLIEASARDQEYLVKLCLERHVDIRHRDVYGREALHYAAMCSARVCRRLLENGADPNTLDFDGATPLIQAISAGQLPCVKALMENLRTNANPTDSAQPLALAAKLGHVPIVSLLLENGYKMLADASGYLPQHIAAKEGHALVLQQLLDAGANPNSPDKFANWTPVFHAANEGHQDCVRILLSAGANLSAVDDQGKTAVHHAAWSGHPEIVSLLITASKTEHTAKVSKFSPATVSSMRKRTADDASADDSMELDVDLIPDLSLPPPALPLRTYGHSYLEGKRCLVQITLGHPTTSTTAVSPIHFYRSDQLSNFKLVITSKSEAFNIPHTVMLPLQDDSDHISLSVDSIDNLALELEVYPTFGSRVIGKAVCLPSDFARIRGIQRFTQPILDNHLNVIGEINFEVNAISHFSNVQLAIGGRLETYWKSITSEAPVKPKSWRTAAVPQEDLSFVTASSLNGEYVKVIVQVTRDGVPVAYPAWRLPLDNVDLHVSDVTWLQLSAIAEKTGKTLNTMPGADADSQLWYSALSNVIAPLKSIFQVSEMSTGWRLSSLILLTAILSCRSVHPKSPFT